MKSGIEQMAEERAAHQSREGFDDARDDRYDPAVLLHAGMSYLMHAAILLVKREQPPACFIPKFWPWSRDWWKPSEDPVRNLVKAGALIAAEIDRIQRERERVI